MVRAIRQFVTIRSGGVIEIRSPDLPPGARVEVIVMLDEPSDPAVPISSLFGKTRGLFKNAGEVDAHLRAERDTWD